MANKLAKTDMSNIVKMIVALAVVGSISGASLVFVYNYATPKIEVNTKKDTEQAIGRIFPETAKIEKFKENGVFKVVDIALGFFIKMEVFYPTESLFRILYFYPAVFVVDIPFM